MNNPFYTPDTTLYARPKKPFKLSKRAELPSEEIDMRNIKAPEILSVDAGTECHVTPTDVAETMADALTYSVGHGGMFLEPSCGTGQLVSALLDTGVKAEQILGVERHHSLAEHTRNRCGINVEQCCFLEFADSVNQQGQFSAILMNPPFKSVRKHMAAARGLLAHDGVMVALVPITFKDDDAELIEELGPDTFPTAKVHTKIIRIEG